MVSADIFHFTIAEDDRRRSEQSLQALLPLATDQDRSLVFFAGAGISTAGHTGMPLTSEILHDLMETALMNSAGEDFSMDHRAALKETRFAFETTLNDFWQICRGALYGFYGALAELEVKCIPNRVHAFLAHWLSTGGTVLTTNYDRLIERKWARESYDRCVRFQEDGNDSLEGWERDLVQGGCLFKLHGSLEQPESCFGAMEHVRSRIMGHRADLLREVLRKRPICFVGWAGWDPDIPPILVEGLAERDPWLPTFWLHYDERRKGHARTIKKALEDTSEVLRPLASSKPILSDADALFGEFFRRIGNPESPNPKRHRMNLELEAVVNQCSTSGLARFVGITARNGRKFELSSTALKIAEDTAETPNEEAAALMEYALLQIERDEQNVDRKEVIAIIKEAGNSLQGTDDRLLKLNVAYGLASNAMQLVRGNLGWIAGWLIYFWDYRRQLQAAVLAEVDSPESLALHKAHLLHMRGEMRLHCFSRLARKHKKIADWILEPFTAASRNVDNAEDIHIHSKIDMLASEALARARLGRREQLEGQIMEINRLTAIHGNLSLKQEWEKKQYKIKHLCHNDNETP